MYVVSLIKDGVLMKTAIKGNANEAVSLAHKWMSEVKNKEDGYIAIDQQSKTSEANERFAEIHFDDDPNKLKLNLRAKGDQPLFTTRFSPVLKSFFFSFLEIALVKLTEVIKNQRGK